MLALTPAEIGGWRGFYRRHPPDAVERLLSLLCRLQCADPAPTDADLRPWAYTPDQAAALRAEIDGVVESRKQEEADRKLTAFMMG